jgi:hypothetical protein
VPQSEDACPSWPEVMVASVADCSRVILRRDQTVYTHDPITRYLL